MSEKLNICSLNCQGLGQKEKRERLNLWCKNQKCNILFIQESHFIEKHENVINNEIKGKLYHSFGNSQSRGVTILIKDNIKYKTINETRDNDGRIILINIELDGNIFTLLNVYAPNIRRNRNSFFKKVNNIINNNRLGILIMGGDMNESLTSFDRKSISPNNQNKPVNSLKQLIKKYKLIDIWRELNQNSSQFTWRRKNNRSVASRIDFFLISPDIRPHIISADIRPALISHTDHQAISLQIRLKAQNKGKGFFKINNSILNDTKYKEIIIKLIDTHQEKILTKNNDPRVTWDIFKTEVREVTIAYCKQKAAESKNEIKHLENKLKFLNEKSSNSQHLKKEINNVENNLQNLYVKETRGAQIRSRVRWAEEGEKNTKYFLGLEKSRQTKKTISALRNDHGNIVTDASDILILGKNYYQNLYKSTKPDPSEIKNYISQTKIDHSLSNSDSELLGGNLTLEECTNAIFNMKLNKSPGLDGLSVEFYRTFWSYLKE